MKAIVKDPRLTCGEECDCPSKMYHRVSFLVRWYEEAPGPPPSLSHVMHELRDMMDEAQDDAGLAVGTHEWVKAAGQQS